MNLLRENNNLPYKVLIVDDEPDAIKLLSHLLKPYSSQFYIVATYSNAKKAKEKIKNEAPDLIFLDIRMPNESGIELAAEIASISPNTKIIFISAYNEYLKDGYKLQPFDFLTKPICPNELNDSLTRFSEKHPLIKAKESSNRIVLPTTRGQELIDSNEILYVKYENRKCTIFHKTGRISYSLLSLNNLTKTLRNKNFVRLSKNIVVNIDSIAVINKNRVELTPYCFDAEDLIFVVGRAFISDFKGLLGI